MKPALVAASAIAILAGARNRLRRSSALVQRSLSSLSNAPLSGLLGEGAGCVVTVKERLPVGATLPAEVELRTVPSPWGPRLAKYRYVYSGDHVYLVEPSDRRVIQIIE